LFVSGDREALASLPCPKELRAGLAGLSYASSPHWLIDRFFQDH